ncbi:SRPBCC family protein [Sphingomonas piscis]|uniref:SRPBCC family protein n=1 Tax=Sphingomonas piscis TaxID=2714943 RepID=A0A6G7YRP6_9SPHN|nr:SRPBCC family protein [Sphingomonas piscis]QIK79415.1 SRPBCC family protein [Sphingomonas piscis]
MAQGRSNHRRDNDNTKALIGAGLAVAAGAATFLLARRSADERGGSGISDAPDHVFRDADRDVVGRTLLVNRSPQELYAEWHDFTRFPSFMDNVRDIVKLDEERSRWTIEAPLGSTVEVVTRITEDQPGAAIAWRSERDSQIETEGRVEFLPAAPGRGTMVRLVIRYSPPGGIVGKGLAKLFQREPGIQARRDLRRFKQLMETGEVSVNASPSGRKSEQPTEARI